MVIGIGRLNSGEIHTVRGADGQFFVHDDILGVCTWTNKNRVAIIGGRYCILNGSEYFLDTDVMNTSQYRWSSKNGLLWTWFRLNFTRIIIDRFGSDIVSVCPGVEFNFLVNTLVFLIFKIIRHHQSNGFAGFNDAVGQGN